jgi:FkbM family methyltransferase
LTSRRRREEEADEDLDEDLMVRKIGPPAPPRDRRATRGSVLREGGAPFYFNRHRTVNALEIAMPEATTRSRATSLHRIGRALHEALARRPTIAGAYLRAAGAVMRRLPDGSALKRRALNNLQSVAWPDVEHAPRRVRLGAATDVLLTPHLGEFDAEALFTTSLGYEREVFALLEPLLERYDAVVEIGANVGVFTLFFAKMLARRTTPGRVFAFEPSGEAFFRLRQNLRLNAVENVDAFNVAVGGATGFAKFFEPRGHLTNGSLHRDFAAYFSDEVVGHDVLVVDGALVASLVAPFPRLLLKIDVEGAESTVLASLEPLIRARRPDILLEVLPTYERALDALPVVDELYDRFSVTARGAEYRERFVGSSDHRDYLLRPKSATGAVATDGPLVTVQPTR